METMSSLPVEPVDLLDLKLLPAWVKEPAEERIYEYAGGEEEGRRSRPSNRSRRDRASRSHESKNGRDRRARGRNREDRRKVFRAIALPDITVRFLPHSPAFDNVVAQIKSSSLVYFNFYMYHQLLDNEIRYNVRSPTY